MGLNYLMLRLFRVVGVLTRINKSKVVTVGMLRIHLAICRLVLKLFARLLDRRCRWGGWRNELVSSWCRSLLWDIFVSGCTFCDSVVIAAQSWTILMSSELLLWVSPMQSWVIHGLGLLPNDSDRIHLLLDSWVLPVQICLFHGLLILLRLVHETSHYCWAVVFL